MSSFQAESNYTRLFNPEKEWIAGMPTCDREARPATPDAGRRFPEARVESVVCSGRSASHHLRLRPPVTCDAPGGPDRSPKLRKSRSVGILGRVDLFIHLSVYLYVYLPVCPSFECVACFLQMLKCLQRYKYIMMNWYNVLPFFFLSVSFTFTL